jgi:hypothetical protein
MLNTSKNKLQFNMAKKLIELSNKNIDYSNAMNQTINQITLQNVSNNLKTPNPLKCYINIWKSIVNDFEYTNKYSILFYLTFINLEKYAMSSKNEANMTIFKDKIIDIIVNALLIKIIDKNANTSNNLKTELFQIIQTEDIYILVFGPIKAYESIYYIFYNLYTYEKNIIYYSHSSLSFRLANIYYDVYSNEYKYDKRPTYKGNQISWKYSETLYKHLFNHINNSSIKLNIENLSNECSDKNMPLHLTNIGPVIMNNYDIHHLLKYIKSLLDKYAYFYINEKKIKNFDDFFPIPDRLPLPIKNNFFDILKYIENSLNLACGRFAQTFKKIKDNLLWDYTKLQLILNNMNLIKKDDSFGIKKNDIIKILLNTAVEEFYKPLTNIFKTQNNNFIKWINEYNNIYDDNSFFFKIINNQSLTLCNNKSPKPLSTIINMDKLIIIFLKILYKYIINMMHISFIIDEEIIISPIFLDFSDLKTIDMYLCKCELTDKNDISIKLNLYYYKVVDRQNDSIINIPFDISLLPQSNNLIDRYLLIEQSFFCKPFEYCFQVNLYGCIPLKEPSTNQIRYCFIGKLICEDIDLFPQKNQNQNLPKNVKGGNLINKKYVNIKNYGKRLIRLSKNNKEYIIINNKRKYNFHKYVI